MRKDYKKMQDKNDGLSRDERDAVSAQMLLQKLRNGLNNNKAEADVREDAPERKAGQISDEAVKLAKAEVIHANPDEFGTDNLEERLRTILNVPKDEALKEESELSYDEESDTVKDVSDFKESDNSEDVTPEVEADDVSELFDFESDEATKPEHDEVQEIFDNMTDEAADEKLEQTVIFEIKEEKHSETFEDSVSADDSDDGFLSKVAMLVGEDKPEPFESDYDEFMFVTDDEHTPIQDGEEPTYVEDNALVGEDGGREYDGLNGAELNSTEMSLLSLFGGIDELEEAYGKEKAKEIIKERSKALIPDAPKKKKFYDIFAPDFEYESYEQNEEIKNKYSKAFKGVSARFLFCLLFTAMLFFFENAEFFKITLPRFLSRDFYPVVVVMVNLQLLLLAAYTVFPRLVLGFENLFKLKPSSESVSSLLLCASVIYSFLIAFASGRPSAAMYNSPTALVFLLTALSDILRLKREAMSFDVVSSSRKKFVVRALSDEEKNEDAKLFNEYVPNDSEMFAVTRTGFAEGFFARNGKSVYNRSISVLMIVAIAGVFLTAGFGLYLSRDTYSVITMAYLALILGLPGTVLLAGCFSLYRISKAAYDGECAIIGAQAVSEYSEGSVVFFDDKDIFPSTGVKINSVKVYGENRIDEVIYKAASIFAKIGGPLADVFSLATIEIGHSDDVTVIDTAPNGVHCLLDNVPIYLGNNDYLVANDFDTPYGEGDVLLERNNGIRLMFIADDNEILAKFYVQYTVDSEYELIFNQLYKAGMCVGIRTWDPNICEDFIMRKLRLKKDYPIKVIHGKPGKEFTRRCERASSGIVSAGSVKSLLKALSSCDKVKYISKIQGIFEIVSAVVAILAVYGVAFLGKLEIGSMFAALYQLFWFIPIMLVAMFAD